MTKLIEDFPDYTISKDGTVTNLKTNHELSSWVGANGYKYVDLRNGNKTKKRTIHRLLAKVFIPNPENKPQVNHIDGNKLNNAVENLEWCTAQENGLHAYTTGLQPYRRNLPKKKYHELLSVDFLQKRKSLTRISEEVDQSLTQLSYHLREAAEEANLLPEYEVELKKAETSQSETYRIK